MKNVQLLDERKSRKKRSAERRGPTARIEVLPQENGAPRLILVSDSPRKALWGSSARLYHCLPIGTEKDPAVFTLVGACLGTPIGYYLEISRIESGKYEGQTRIEYTSGEINLSRGAVEKRKVHYSCRIVNKPRLLVLTFDHSYTRDLPSEVGTCPRVRLGLMLGLPRQAIHCLAAGEPFPTRNEMFDVLKASDSDEYLTSLTDGSPDHGGFWNATYVAILSSPAGQRGAQNTASDVEQRIVDLYIGPDADLQGLANRLAPIVHGKGADYEFLEALYDRQRSIQWIRTRKLTLSASTDKLEEISVNGDAVDIGHLGCLGGDRFVRDISLIPCDKPLALFAQLIQRHGEALLEEVTHPEQRKWLHALRGDIDDAVRFIRESCHIIVGTPLGESSELSSARLILTPKHAPHPDPYYRSIPQGYEHFFYSHPPSAPQKRAPRGTRISELERRLIQDPQSTKYVLLNRSTHELPLLSEIRKDQLGYWVTRNSFHSDKSSIRVGRVGRVDEWIHLSWPSELVNSLLAYVVSQSDDVNHTELLKNAKGIPRYIPLGVIHPSRGYRVLNPSGFLLPLGLRQSGDFLLHFQAQATPDDPALQQIVISVTISVNADGNISIRGCSTRKRYLILSDGSVTRTE